MDGAIEFSLDLFARISIERLVLTLERLLDDLAENGNRRMGALTLLGAAERRQVLDEANTMTEVVSPETVASARMWRTAGLTPLRWWRPTSM